MKTVENKEIIINCMKALSDPKISNVLKQVVLFIHKRLIRK